VTRDPRYDILFEPLAIGPVTAPNRFYQVPHCNGMGRVYPNAMIGMRGAKAEGGWGIVCTEQCDFLANGDASPYAETNMWDAGDEVYLGRMVDDILNRVLLLTEVPVGVGRHAQRDPGHFGCGLDFRLWAGRGAGHT